MKLQRRDFLQAGVAALLWPSTAGAFDWVGRFAHHEQGLPAKTLAALEKSPFVYVSPLKSDGSESTCHAEVWFGFLDGAVVLNTGRDRWKSRSVERGLDRARIWVGDHGRWKGLMGSRNEEFRKAPSFVAKAERVTDVKVSERLLGVYGTKYPKEIGEWRDKMRAGVKSGERVLIRYTPVA